MLRTGIFRAPPVTDGAFLFSATSDRLGPCDGRMQGHVGEPLARFSCLSCEGAACRRRFSSVSMGRPEVASRLEAVSGTLVCSEERPRKVDSSTCSAWACSQRCGGSPAAFRHLEKSGGTIRRARGSIAQPREWLTSTVKVGSLRTVAD
jgi:hypothetical protein